MVAQQEDNARVREDNQIIDDGLSLASSTFSMNGGSFSNMRLVNLNSLQSTHLLEEDNNEKDGIILDEEYLLLRKIQLMKQLKDEVAKSKNVRNRLLHPCECEADVDGEGKLLGFGSAYQAYLDENYVNDKTCDNVSTSDHDTNTDLDSDDHSDHTIPVVRASMQDVLNGSTAAEDRQDIRLGLGNDPNSTQKFEGKDQYSQHGQLIVKLYPTAHLMVELYYSNI